MRYWEPAEPKRRRAARTRSAATKSARRSIASGGNIREYPFLRAFYQHQAVISGRIQKFLFFLVIATLLYVFVIGDAGGIRIFSLKHEKSTLENRVAALQANIALLQSNIDQLKNDPFTMEKIGRERYGFVYPGDRVFKLIHQKRK